MDLFAFGLDHSRRLAVRERTLTAGVLLLLCTCVQVWLPACAAVKAVGQADRTSMPRFGMRESYAACLRTKPRIQDHQECSFEEGQYQDVRLNRTYKALRSALAAAPPESDVALVRAERAWLDFRDADCDARAQRAGSDAAPVERSECHMLATAMRAQELEDWLTTLAVDRGALPSAVAHPVTMECGRVRVALTPGSQRAVATVEIRRPGDGASIPLSRPDEMADYGPIGIACVQSKTGQAFVAVQFGEAEAGCQVCEWVYVYDSDGRQLNHSRPVFMHDTGRPAAQRTMPNNAEYTALAKRLGLTRPEFRFLPATR